MPEKPLEAMEDLMATRIVAIPKTPENSAANAPVDAAPAARPEAKARPKPESKGAERIGDILRQARLDRGDDLYQIADYLCIKPSFLIALENSRYDEFPADAYVIGFLRTYASFLGVDGKEAVDRYRYEMAGRRKKPVLSMPIPLSEGRAPSVLIMVGATVAALLIYALWYGISSTNRTEVNAPPPLPVAQQSAPAVLTDTPSAAAGLTAPISAAPSISSSTVSSSAATAIPPAPPGIVVTAADQSPPAVSPLVPPSAPLSLLARDDQKPADQPVKDAKDAKDSKDKSQIYGDPGEAARIIIRATQSSWVMVMDATGKAIFDHVLKPGDTYKVPNKPGLTLTTGNGAGIVLVLDGADLPKIASGAPHVVKNIPLDPGRLTTEPLAQ